MANLFDRSRARFEDRRSDEEQASIDRKRKERRYTKARERKARNEGWTCRRCDNDDHRACEEEVRGLYCVCPCE